MSPALRTLAIASNALFMPSTRFRHAPMQPLLHLLLALALMVQALASAAIAVSGMTHRHSPAGVEVAPSLPLLVDFRRHQEALAAHTGAHAHAQAARHHHGPSDGDVLRTAEDQMSDQPGDAAEGQGLAAQLALLPPSSSSLRLASTPPRVAHTPWGATMHAPSLPERPPRADGAFAPVIAA